MIEHPGDRRVDALADAGLLGGQIDKTDGFEACG